MTSVIEPAGGDSEIAAPAGTGNGADTAGDAFDEGERVETDTPTRGRPTSTAVLLLGAILVIVLAQLVLTWFVFTTTTQVRDQYTSANGLQRCLIRAQLNENQTTDPSGTVYKAAVNSCLK